MAPAQRRPRPLDPVADGHVLRLGIDLGTGKIQVDGQYVQGPAARDKAIIRPICLNDDESARVEQTAIIPEIGPVIYGTVDVETALAANPSLQDKVLELWKLALHPEFQHLEEVRHVLATLYAQTDVQEDRGAVQDFIEEQLRGIIQDIRNYYKTPNRNARKDAACWDRIPLELQISVPAMWGDYQRGVVRNAACNALGNSSPHNKVELREEPLCVATVNILELVTYGGIQEGECIVLLDCGKGTLDIATVRLVRVPSDGVNMQLQRVGPCSGSGAGSHTVNIQAWNWILSGACQDVQDLDKCCAQLNIPRREFLRQFSKGVDYVKSETYTVYRDSFITIYSGFSDRRQGRVSRLSIMLPKEEIMSWYKVWTDSATQLVKEHLDVQRNQQYRYASFTGGGFGSTVFRRAMTSVLTQAPYPIEIGVPTPRSSSCSEGALQQHCFQEDKLPSYANFYLSRTEMYQPKFHADVTRQPSDYKSRKTVAHERLQKIMQYENGTFSGAE